MASLKEISKNSFPRFNPSLFLSLAFILTMTVTGCQSERERKIAEAESKLRGVSLSTQNNPSSLQTNRPGSEDTTIPTASSEDRALGMPLYPGSKPYTEGATTLTNTGDGIAMTLLETGDSVDQVMAFYQKKLRAEFDDPSVSATSVKEEIRDGKRVARLTKPLSSGGLQSVEARQVDSKTIIELMNIQSVTSGKLSMIPGSVMRPSHGRTQKDATP